MAVKVRIPTPLRKLTNGSDEVTASGANVAEIIEDLERNYPGLKERICEDNGKLRRFVNIYLNDEDIRFKENMETALRENDELSIIPAIAGGVS
ncbi:MAG TPA: molybdopterin synthase sulfur carrier subunit [Deltaproteobacteria bacterium]|nr:MAG: molybdopterin synthase sulfur carrier subunit [Deltaproteobacteria bacterium GWA2_55_82]OGQ63394.1 MAG: molybdopterin synthase sulfur carrier subunit [Deltaproteobacteria bacterium RIFCSPLOWO2_02_FULL_55_12]OIJ73192.1 MAG: molybdopterin synthase sulfur carrier subunit [Deltaproteobacteria bacterium GWC2_55_46]HBG45551.1 molybdopterin synthase sulfur carrier subunit [Deltaproteobacteria bacterium]HCY10382.1 molybdopterin synthase sulfur carrier subunit [Deltaproteobacteria bacterium]